MALALVAASVTFFSTMAGGITALRWPTRVEVLMALAGGVVLAAALVDLLPEAIKRAQDLGMPLRTPLAATLAGYLVFHGVERWIHRDGAHADDDRPDAAGLAGATGFVVHSFFDGLAIGLGFRVDSALGLLVAAAVIGHDFSDGLTTVSYLVAHRHSRERSRRFLLADSLTPILGALVASLVPIPDKVFPIALGFFSGLFIYAAATNLLPRAQALPPRISLSTTAVGAAAMLAISLLA
jgi:zinc transporter ZupT